MFNSIINGLVEQECTIVWYLKRKMQVLYKIPAGKDATFIYIKKLELDKRI